MNEEKKIDQTNKDQQPQTLSVPELNVVDASQTRIHSKLNFVEKFSDLCTQEAEMILDTDSLETEIIPNVDFDEFFPELENLGNADVSKPYEYLIKSQGVLKKATKFINDSENKKLALEQSIRSLRGLLQRIDTELSGYEEKKGLQRFLSRSAIHRLQKQKLEAQKQIIAFTGEIRQKVEANNKIIPYKNEFMKKHENMMFSLLEEKIKSIRADYQKLLETVLEDGTVCKEVRSSYISNVVNTQLERLSKENKVSESVQNHFFESLQKCIDHRESTDDQRILLKEELDIFFTLETGFWELKETCNPLLTGKDEDVVAHLIAKITAKKIKKIYEYAKKRHNKFPTIVPREYSYDGKLFSLFESSITEHGGGTEQKFEGGVINQFRDDDDYFIPNMEFWQAIKSSESANAIFGEVIQDHDEQYYAKAMDKSVSDFDGRYIDILRYYPTPDAIRNLVIIAAADVPGYSTVHANWSLSSLRQHPKWREILDHAENSYPQLANVRPILETWDHRAYHHHPRIGQTVEGLALSILEDKSSDSRLANLAIDSLPNHRILDLLVRRGVVEEVQANTLKDVGLFLREISGNSFLEEAIRENLTHLIESDLEITEKRRRLATIDQLAVLSQVVLENKNDFNVVTYLSGENVTKKVQSILFDTKELSDFIDSYKVVPALLTDKSLAEEFCSQFMSDKTTSFFRDMCLKYQDKDVATRLISIINLVGKEKLSMERALELPEKAEDILKNPLFDLLLEFPDLFLSTDKDVEFFKQTLAAYGNDKVLISDMARFIKNGELDKELSLLFPRYATVLLDPKMREMKLFVLQHSAIFLKDASDLQFIGGLIGEFGKKSDQLIKGYRECLVAGAITTADKDLVREFVHQFRVISPETIQGYKEAKSGGVEKVYIAELQSLAERMAGSKQITAEERGKPRYKDLLRHVYSNNSGSWASYEGNEACTDRNMDLSQFNLRPRYEMDLLSQSEVRVKNGETLDLEMKENIQKPILAVAERMNSLGHNKEKVLALLQENIEKELEQIKQHGGLRGIEKDSITLVGEKLFLVLVDSIYGTRVTSPEIVKDLLINYEFATFEDINDYISGTSDRVTRANNQDYALFCEVGAFYSDRIKEVNRDLVQTGWNNPIIAATMPDYFKRLAVETTKTQRRDSVNRLQIEKLGESERFLAQAKKALDKKGKKYDLEMVKRIIRRYESMTNGLYGKKSTSTSERTRAFYGQLRSQREKTLEALRIITGKEVDASQIHLGEINLQQALDVETNIEIGKYEDEQFASYTVQKFIDIFEDERTKIDRELAKFESLSGKKREVLYGYVTKSKESANARMVGGVCVSGDNPGKSKENMWDSPNYFQLVLQEPDTLQCQGLVLLHHFTENGEKILTASFNPSSTYLYSVDEAALFKNMSNVLESFAQDNGFDIIAVSRNKAIRTNRTGGKFEETMDKKISEVGKQFKFSETKIFSYNPPYQLQEMDVIWEKTKQ